MKRLTFYGSTFLGRGRTFGVSANWGGGGGPEGHLGYVPGIQSRGS